MRILTINVGTSSLKVALYQMAQAPTLLLAGRAERIGLPAGRVHITDVAGTSLLEQRGDLPDHDSALHLFFSSLARERPDLAPHGVGHRIVHGGSEYREPRTITATLLVALRKLVPIDPDHMPQAMRAVQAAARA